MVAYFGRPDEDLAQDATAVSGSAEDPSYLAANIRSENPAKPAKLTTNDGWFLYEFAAPVTPQWTALIYQYLDPDLDVRIQGNDTSDFSSPAYERQIVIPSKRLDGPANQRWTVNPWVYLDYEETPPSYQFWRLYIAAENSQPVCIGRWLLMSQLREIDMFYDGDGLSEDDQPTNLRDETEVGVKLVTVIGGPQRGLSYVWLGTDLSAGTDPQEALAFRQLHEAADGDARPFPIIPFGTNDVLLVRPDTPNASRVHRPGGYQSWAYSVREESRGIPWP